MTATADVALAPRFGRPLLSRRLLTRSVAVLAVVGLTVIAVAAFEPFFAGSTWRLPVAIGVFMGAAIGLAVSSAAVPPLIRAAVAVVVLSLVAFVPPWLSARFADHGDFSAAKVLDPLSVDPYRLEASEAATPRAAVEQLEAAVRKEPRVADVRYELGLAYARAGEVRRARAALLQALRLAPGDPQIAEALKRLPKRPIRSS